MDKEKFLKYLQGLKRVSTIAKEEGISATAVYNRVKKEQIPIVIIDGMQFVDTNK